MKKQLKVVSTEWRDLTDALTRTLDQLRATHGLDRQRLVVDVKHLVQDLEGLARAAFLAYMSRRRRESPNTQSGSRKRRQRR